MVAQPSDAEDATQEILIKVMTRLSTFKGDAGFTTWVHRIGVNHLLDRKKTQVERLEVKFDFYAEDLRTGLAEPSARSGPDNALLAEEIKLSCTQAMLTCLDRQHRGVVNKKAACRCSKRIEAAVTLGRLDPNNLEFVGHPDYVAPDTLTDRIGDLVRSGSYGILR